MCFLNWPSDITVRCNLPHWYCSILVGILSTTSCNPWTPYLSSTTANCPKTASLSFVVKIKRSVEALQIIKMKTFNHVTCGITKFCAILVWVTLWSNSTNRIRRIKVWVPKQVALSETNPRLSSYVQSWVHFKIYQWAHLCNWDFCKFLSALAGPLPSVSCQP